MVVIRPTGDLAKRMKVKLAQTDLTSSSLLGDWYALDLVIEKQQYILCVSENGRLPVILKAAPYADFPTRLLPALRETLHEIGIPEEKIHFEISQMSETVLAKTVSRSVLGSMNEFRFSLQSRSQMGRLTHEPLKMSLWLTELISLILPDSTPKNSALKVFGEPIPPHPRRSNLSLVRPNE